MQGYFRRRNCSCGKSRCTCGAKWSYTVDIGIDPRTGKRRQKSKSGFKTKSEAESAAAQILSELSQGTYVSEQDTLFKDFALDWLKMYKATGVKISSVVIREKEVAHLTKQFGHARLRDVTKKMYQEFLNDIISSLAYNTVSGIHTAGRMLFAKAVELDMLKASPAALARVPIPRQTVEELESENEVPRYLELAELQRLLQTARELGLLNDYLIFKSLAYTGLRTGELCALKWRDINTMENTVSVTKTLYIPGNNITQYQLLPPKTKSSRRTVDIDPGLIQEIKKHKTWQAKIRISTPSTYHDGDFVFGRVTGRHLGYPTDPKTLQYRMKRLLRLAGIDHSLPPHSLRHTHTSLLAEAGVGLDEIMDRLGHSDSKTTRTVYLHVTQTRKKDAAQKFSELMNGVT